MDFNTTTAAIEPTTVDSQVFSGVGHALRTAAIAALIFAVCAYFPKLKVRMQLAKLPRFDGETGQGTSSQNLLLSSKVLYSEGYERFKDRVYRFTNSDDENVCVVPLSLLQEFRKLGDDVLSFPKAVDSTMETYYTNCETDARFIGHVAKSNLTPALSRISPAISAEVDVALKLHVPPCNEWTEVAIFNKLVDIIARVSGRVFVGEELCQDSEYLDCGSNYTINLMEAVHAIKPIRPWLRPFLVPRLPEIRKLRDMEKRAAKHLEPIVRERVEAAKRDPDWQKPDDMMQWMIDYSAKQGTLTVEYLAKKQLGLIFAAVHTTTTSVTNVLYSLAVTPEYVQPLRDEIVHVMSQNDGRITAQAMQQMVKLDSYMKEVTRFFPIGIISFQRRVLKGITLSNGQYIPPGVIIHVPTEAIHTDSAHFSDGSTFDGFRHLKLRQGGTASDHARNQLVSANELSLGFGYGSHACPGRFFAVNEMKMIVARLLLDYDIKMPGDATERWPQLYVGGNGMPDPGKTIMLKRREV